MASIETDAAYALWAAHYPPAPHNALMEVEHRAVLSVLPPVAALTTLDAGCGTGRYLRVLADHGAARVYGVDRSAAMLAHAKGARVVQGDVSAMPFASSSVDVVVSGLALNDIEDLGAAMREIGRVLKPSGVVVYSTLHPRGADAQWTRTFEAAGHTWSLPVYWHSLDAHQRACVDAGLMIEQRLEPELTGRGPVALIIRASRYTAVPYMGSLRRFLT